MPQISVNNVTLHYTESGQGTPLLLLHGVGGSHEIWLPVIPELAKSHRVIAADHRGHGKSAKPRGSYSIRLFAEDWVALMEAFRIDRAHVLGLSMGGAIAMQLAAEHSQRVQSLVLVDTWAFPHPDFLAMLRQRLEALATGDLAAYAEAVIPQLYSPEFIRANPKALADYRARATSLDPGTLRSSVQACMVHDMLGRLQTIKAPTLVLVGSEDRLLPPFHSEYLHGAIPGARLSVIKASGHFPHLEHPREFLQAVTGFLAPH